MRWATRHYDDILLALWQHLVLVGTAMLMAFAISLFLGITTARRPRLYALVMAVTGMIFSIPGLALFALLIPWLGIGMLPAIVGLTAYALMILTRNIATGFHAIPLDVREAARGMGYGAWRNLREVELPLALPFIITGLRIATTTLIGIATVAAYINAGGLGAIILAGLDQRYPEKIFIGGGLTSLLAIGADLFFVRLQRRVLQGRDQ
ncbi:ABC transporter permease [Citrobacter sp. CK184]|uniref:ABC transporter permease n=1 Tax=Citrobacter koseri TaxID=545 RepID=A0A3S4MA29_CITKO|nr:MULTISPECIES: ABC transporter permease [Citrobacter]EMD6812132.1 ABC transporter permease [Citrobacter koseri]MBJ8875614.1 ABC transporter permease [Citrobacter koseri]MDM2961743.1 ABC transporter permease [Citrobacter sp. CK202]MDM3029659.1 ABC transporter permease [Citrobacter sp. CK185]MDM3047805.1 ABC transporter permease [Citrobacter sp. CK184]